MAEIHNILGAVLRDTVRARATSDVYSRDISRYYENDPLLRRFPVPRAEIEELSLDLHFAIDSISDSKTDSCNEEITLATVFSEASFDLTQAFFTALIESVDANGSSQASDESKAFRKRLGGTSARINVQQDLLSFLSRDQGLLISDGKMRREHVLRGVRRVLAESVQRLADAVELDAEQVPDMKAALSSEELSNQVNVMAASASEVLSSSTDLKVDIEVAASALQALPASCVSTLRLKASVKNYTWSEVDKVEGRTWRQLSPE